MKKKLDAFGVKVNDFKNEFKSNLPYLKIDEYYLKLQKFEQEARENA